MCVCVFQFYYTQKFNLFWEYIVISFLSYLQNFLYLPPSSLLTFKLMVSFSLFAISMYVWIYKYVLYILHVIWYILYVYIPKVINTTRSVCYLFVDHFGTDHGIEELIVFSSLRKDKYSLASWSYFSRIKPLWAQPPFMLTCL